ncbi:MAG TPA: hypothetical protein VF334_13190 [Polyangia bacterium]
MKAALLLLAAAVVGAAGCTNNDISLSITQMQAITRLNMCMATVGGTALMTRNRGLLDVAKVTTAGYIAVPVVRNNLLASTGTVEFNSIQVQGANIKLSTAAGAALTLPSGQSSFFYGSAGGRLDPGMTAPMFVEVISADVAHALAGMIPATGVFTVVAELRPVGMRSSDQVIGGPIDFPIDLCNGCLTETSTCPLAKGTVVMDPCFVQQDDPTICCVDATGATLCGGAAPVGM